MQRFVLLALLMWLWFPLGVQAQPTSLPNGYAQNVIPIEQRMVLTRGQQLQLTLEMTFRVAGSDAAIWLPLPTGATVELADTEPFTALAALSAARIEREEQALVFPPTPSPIPTPAAPALTQPTTVTALQGQAATNTLPRELPAAVRSALVAHLAGGGTIARIEIDGAAGRTAPIRINLPQEQLPVLADTPIDLYVLGAQRIAVDGLNTWFAGPTAGAAGLPQDSPAYLTRLYGIADGPFVLRDSAEGPLQRTEREIVYVDPFVRLTGPIIALVLICSLNVIGAGLVLVIRKRIVALGGPPDSDGRRSKRRLRATTKRDAAGPPGAPRV